MARVILPQPGLRRELLLELRLQSERRAVLIDRQRGGAGGIDADADDVFRLEAALALRGRNRTADRREKAVDVIGRTLSREIRVFLIEQHARIAAGIIVDVRCQLITVFQVDYQCPHAIGAVVDSDGVFRFTLSCHASSVHKVATGGSPVLIKSQAGRLWLRLNLPAFAVLSSNQFAGFGCVLDGQVYRVPVYRLTESQC